MITIGQEIITVEWLDRVESVPTDSVVGQSILNLFYNTNNYLRDNLRNTHISDTRNIWSAITSEAMTYITS